MKYMYKIVAFVTLLIFAEGAYSQNWVYCCATPEQNKLYFRSDIGKESFDGSDSALKVWTKTEYKKFDFGDTSYSNAVAMVLAYLDCEAKKFSVSSMTIYDQNGNLIANQDFGKIRPNREIPPKSSQKNVMEQACKYYNK